MTLFATIDVKFAARCIDRSNHSVWWHWKYLCHYGVRSHSLLQGTYPDVQCHICRYRQQDSPRYHICALFCRRVNDTDFLHRYLNGIWATIGCQFLMLVLLAVTSITFIRRNRLAREGKIGPLEGQPGFYYTL